MRKRILTKQVGAVISEAMYQQLIEVTDRMEISSSKFIREAIQDKIDQCKLKDSCIINQAKE